MITRTAVSVVHGAAERLVANTIRKTLPWACAALALATWWIVVQLGPWWPVLPALVGAFVFRRPLWWLVRHPAWAATGIVSAAATVRWDPTIGGIAGVLTLAACVTLWIGALVARGTARGFAPIVTGLSRYMLTRLRWDDTCRRMQPQLVSRHTGQVLHASYWRITDRGLTTRLHTGGLGLHAAAASTWAENLTAVIGCSRVRISVHNPGTVEAHFDWGEHLRQHLSLHDIPEVSPERRGRYLCIGIDENGDPLEIPLGSWMIAALSGMGKSSLFWAILYDLLRQFGPACIRLVVIDPKRVEWSVAEKHAQESPIVQAYAGSPMQWGDNGIRKGGDGWLQVNVEQLIEDRLVEYASNGYRDHTPTPDSPIIFVLVDETLPLASSLRKLKENHPLAKAAFMGRAIGVYLLFATQAAEKDVLGLIRDLINNRACGRMLSKDQVDMAMGDDSVKHGANAHLLHPVEDRGVFYFRDEAARIFAGRVGYAEDADTVDLIMGRIPVRRPPKPPRDLYAPRDTYVYHLYNRQGERIYIGKSVNPAKRLEQHCDGEHEWSDEIDPAGMVVDSLWDSEAAALVEERRQIERATRNGELLYNVAHNKGRVRVPVGAAVAVDPWELEG